MDITNFLGNMLTWIEQHPYEFASGLFLALLPVVLWVLRLPLSAFLFFLRKLLARRRRLEDALQILGESVELVDKNRLAHPASPNRIRQFHDGGGLSWDVIAEGGDIQRDKHGELLGVLRTKEQGQRLICIVGIPGAGKSTMAWRAAVELYQQDGALVLWAKRTHDAEFWFHLTEFHSAVHRDIYILIDDIFRYDDVVQALRALDPALPITVLATSQTSEFRPRRLTSEPLVVLLEGPSEPEKNRMLKKLGRSQRELSRDEQARLDRATDFRVMMWELTTGHDHAEGMTETVRGLAETDPIGHDAYKYVCFCYQYGVSIPNSILDKLQPQGRFYRIDQRPAMQGLILPDEARPGCLRAGHITTAITAFGAFYQAPSFVLSEVVSVADEALYEHRNFAADLVSRVLATEESVPPGTLTDIAPVLSSMARCAERIGEILLWRRCFRTIGMAAEADACEDALVHACEDALTNVPPVNASECNALVEALGELGREKEALLPLLAFVQANPQTSGMRRALFNLIERYGTPTQVDDTVLGSREWLTEHPEDSFHHAGFLGLVERKGTPEQIQALIVDTRAWLADHPEYTFVRTSFMGMMERKGTPEQVESLIHDTKLWLNDRPEDSHTLAVYLGLVERKGTPEQVESLIHDTKTWLNDHPDDAQTRASYLGLVEREGTPEQAQTLIDDTRAWLVDRPEHTFVRIFYASLIGREGTPDQVRALIQETNAWLAEHPEDAHIRQNFLGLVEREGTSEQIMALIGNTNAWLADHPEDTHVRTTFLGLVEREGTSEQIMALIGDTRAWLADHPEDTRTREAFPGLVEQKGTPKQIQALIDDTHAWLNDHPEVTQARAACLWLVDRQGTTEQAQALIEDTHTWLADHPEDTNTRQSFLALVRRKGAADQVRIAIKATAAWLASNVNEIHVRRVLLNLISHSGDEEELSQAARDLAEWAEQTTFDPQSRDVRLISTALGGGRRLSHAVTKEIQDAVDRLGVEIIVAEGFPDDQVQQTHFAIWLGAHQYQDEAERLYLKTMERPPDRTSYRSRNQHIYGYGQFLLKEERWPEAQEVLRQLPRNHIAGRLGLASTLEAMARTAKDAGESSKAARLFQEAERELVRLVRGNLRHKLTPSPAPALSRLGWVYLSWDKFENALATFEEAISTPGEEHFGSFWGKGKTLVELARIGKMGFQDAQIALTAAMQLLPNESEGEAAEEIRTLLEECDQVLQA